jgi:hypothetical protein
MGASVDLYNWPGETVSTKVTNLRVNLFVLGMGFTRHLKRIGIVE